LAFKGILINLPGQQAGEDLENSQYHFVKFNNDGDIVECEAGDEGEAEAIGVLQYDPDDGISASVAVAGLTKIVAGEALSKGDYITPDGEARAKVAGETDVLYGRVIHGVDSADEIATALIGYVPSETDTT